MGEKISLPPARARTVIDRGGKSSLSVCLSVCPQGIYPIWMSQGWENWLRLSLYPQLCMYAAIFKVADAVDRYLSISSDLVTLPTYVRVCCAVCIWSLMYTTYTGMSICLHDRHRVCLLLIVYLQLSQLYIRLCVWWIVICVHFSWKRKALRRQPMKAKAGCMPDCEVVRFRSCVIIQYK